MKLLSAFVFLLAGCAATSAPPPAAIRFDLQSSFLVNLHQRLLGDAAERRPRTFDELQPEDRAIWQEAVEVYRKGDRDELRDFRIALANSADSADPKWRAVLDRTAPVYRKTWWPEHDAGNREFLAMLQPLLDEHGAVLLQEHARVYGNPVPSYVRLDLTSYAGPFGAQTVIDDAGMPYVTIALRDDIHRGRGALELVMHESSHSLAFPDRGVIGGVINDHAATLGVKPPRDLWHAILFFNTGEITRRYFAARGVEYEPYAFKTGVYDRMNAKYLPAVRKWWPQVIDGAISREEGVRRIVEEVAER